MKRIGVLALQGCVAPHMAKLRAIGAVGVEVRTLAEFNSVDGLIIPGGESTTMLKLLAASGLDKELSKFSKPVWGVCAGAILIAKKVSNPTQQSFGLINIEAVRNFYGSQLESFTYDLKITGIAKRQTAPFIRAPKLIPLSPKVETLASIESNAVLLREGNILAGSFHPELAAGAALHEYFAKMA